MKTTITNNRLVRRCERFLALSAALMTVCLLQAGPIATNPPGFKIIKPHPGGLSPKVEVGSISRSGTNLILEIGGLRGPYSVERQPAIGQPWSDMGISVDATKLTVPMVGEMGFLRVKGQPYNYVGASVCALCHPGVH